MRSETSGPVAAGRTLLPLRRPPPETDARLVYDRTPPPDGSFDFFRCTGDLSRLDASHDLTGLADLNLSGSEGFSTLAQAEALRQRAGDEPLHVFNLRLESAAIVDGYPATVRGRFDWVNAGLSHDEAVAREDEVVADLRAREQVTLARWVDVKLGSEAPHEVTLDAPAIRTEQELVDAIDGILHRLTVTDHLRPDRLEVDRFIDIVRTLPPSTPVHMHCKGGRGRTTTFMVMYDMLRNAHRVPAAAIIRRQEVLGLNYNMLHYNPINPERWDFAQDRHAFLIEFHAYAMANPGGQPMRWSEWRMSDAEEVAGPSGQASVGGI